MVKDANQEVVPEKLHQQPLLIALDGLQVADMLEAAFASTQVEHVHIHLLVLITQQRRLFAKTSTTVHHLIQQNVLTRMMLLPADS